MTGVSNGMESTLPSDSSLCLPKNNAYTDEIMILVIGIASILTLLRALYGPNLFAWLQGKGYGKARQHYSQYELISEDDDDVSRSLDRLGGENMEGFLWKKDHRLKSWRRRYFVLNIDGKVNYYSNPEEARRGAAPKGTFSVYSASPWNERQFGIQILTTLGSVYYLYAEAGFFQRKWILGLTRRAPKVAIRGQVISPPHDRPQPVNHKLEVIVNTASGLEKERQYYAVIKFKSELHDFSHTSVGQTTAMRYNGQGNAQNHVVQWDETFSWNYLDHECESCTACQSAGMTTGIFRGLPYTLVCQVWEQTMFKDKKVGSSSVGLLDLFGYAGMEKSEVVSCWPLVMDDIVVGQAKLTFKYEAERATGKQPFLSSSAQERTLICDPKRTVLKISTAEDFFETFWADDADSSVWESYYKIRGDKEVTTGEWVKSPIYDGKVRTITFRSLTNAPIGPTTTMTTTTEHALFSEDRSVLYLSTRVVLHDIPYGDCFTVETCTIVTTNATKSGISIAIHLAVPFTKGCMWKSKILSNTQDNVTESQDLLYRTFNEKMEKGPTDPAPVPRLEVLHSAFSLATDTDPVDEGTPQIGRVHSVSDGTVALEEIFENQRISLFGKWGPGHLLLTDRPRFSNRSGDMPMDFMQVVAPPDWVWTSEWKIDYNYTKCDEEGWSYATDFPRFTVHLQRGRSSTKRLGASVRRRRWIRTLTKTNPNT